MVILIRHRRLWGMGMLRRWSIQMLGTRIQVLSAIHEYQESLRKIKKKVQTMLHGSAAFVRTLNLCINEEEDLDLMNLSRIISHPHMFIQPVDAITLQEKSWKEINNI